MTELTKFDFDGMAEVRVVTIDGEPWFVASDVCRVLGFSNGPKAVRDHVLTGQASTITVRSGTSGGNPNKTIISEPGLYRLIMRSKVDGAERFQDWVTAEVLPTIRKTGGAYIAPGSDAAKAMLDNPLDAIEQTLKVARELESRNRELEAEAEQNAPLVEFASAVKASENALTFEETAKILNEKHGIETGRNRLIRTLASRGVLRKIENRTQSGYIPYQRYMKYFEVAPSEFRTHTGTVVTRHTTYVKASALPWIVREMAKTSGNR